MGETDTAWTGVTSADLTISFDSGVVTVKIEGLEEDAEYEVALTENTVADAAGVDAAKKIFGSAATLGDTVAVFTAGASTTDSITLTVPSANFEGHFGLAAGTIIPYTASNWTFSKD